MVGARGFEPPTSSSRTMRATRLRHAPTEVLVVQSLRMIAGPVPGDQEAHSVRRGGRRGTRTAAVRSHRTIPRTSRASGPPRRGIVRPHRTAMYAKTHPRTCSRASCPDLSAPSEHQGVVPFCRAAARRAWVTRASARKSAGDTAGQQARNGVRTRNRPLAQSVRLRAGLPRRRRWPRPARRHGSAGCPARQARTRPPSA